MRWFLGLWFLPIAFLASWLALASHDIDLGTVFFSRAMYDLVFGLYADVLGIPAADLPPMVVKALIIDSSIVLAIYVFRRRRPIAVWIRRRYEASESRAVSPRLDRLSSRIDSLSSAP